MCWIVTRSGAGRRCADELASTMNIESLLDENWGTVVGGDFNSQGTATLHFWRSSRSKSRYLPCCKMSCISNKKQIFHRTQDHLKEGLEGTSTRTMEAFLRLIQRETKVLYALVHSQRLLVSSRLGPWAQQNTLEMRTDVV